MFQKEFAHRYKQKVSYGDKIGAIKLCYSNYDFIPEEYACIKDTIKTCIYKDVIVIKSIGLGQRAKELTDIIEMIIQHTATLPHKPRIHLVGYDIYKERLNQAETYIAPLRHKYKGDIAYYPVQIDIFDIPNWSKFIEYPSDVIIWRHTWVNCGSHGEMLTEHGMTALAELLLNNLNGGGALVISEMDFNIRIHRRKTYA